MRSFSNEIPNASKTVAAEDFNKFVSDNQTAMQKLRSWVLGLALYSAVLTLVVLVVALHH